MLIKSKKEIERGYNPIITADEKTKSLDLELDFGIITLEKGDIYSNVAPKERAFILIEGDVIFEFGKNKEHAKRDSFLDECPVCMHLPRDSALRITANEKSELAFVAVPNNNIFVEQIYGQDECRTDIYGKGIINNLSMRYVRTIFEDINAPYSNLAVGEVVNFPGKWSSYPPHHHPQPEIYHYRLYPNQGFGIGCAGEQAYVLHNRDTLIIQGDSVHPQVAAPGYAMYYLWIIPHTPVRWKSERISLKKDDWLLDKDAIIWPEKKQEV